MPRLTAELIAESPQFTNPVKDRELDLRGKLSLAAFTEFMAVEGLSPSNPCNSHALCGDSLVLVWAGYPATALQCVHVCV